MAGLQKEYDVIVVGGGGVNGLAVSAYLQKAGLKVAAFERRDEVGTFCSTEELLWPGVKMNIHAVNVIAQCSPAYEELEMERFGYYPVTASEWGCFDPFLDKSAVLFHNWDARKQYEAWQRLSEKDAETFRKLCNALAPRFAELMEFYFYTPPSMDSMARVRDIIFELPMVPKDLPDMTGIEVVQEIWENEHIQTGQCLNAIMGGTEPWLKGSGVTVAIIGAPRALAYGVNWTARGGSHALPHALSRCFLHYGGSLFQGCPVDRIIVENNEAKGVVLSKDAIFPEAEVYAKRAIVSNLSPHPTFIKLVGLDKLPPQAQKGVMQYDYEGQILFTTVWVLNEPPDWPGYPQEIDKGRTYNFNWGLENIAEIWRLQNSLFSGRLPHPPGPTGGSYQGHVLADPTAAPPGQWPVQVWCDVPYDIRYLGGPEKWDDIREEYADEVEDLLSQYMANVKKAKMGRYVATPLDNYRRNPSAIKGTWSGGPPLRRGQTWDDRPFPGCGAPRTPIDRLYLCQSTWSFAGTHISTGYITACVVAEDLGVRKQDWWTVKPGTTYPRMLAKRGITWKPNVD